MLFFKASVRIWIWSSFSARSFLSLRFSSSRSLRVFSFWGEVFIFLFPVINGIRGDIVFSCDLAYRGARKISFSKDFNDLVNGKFSLSHVIASLWLLLNNLLPFFKFLYHSVQYIGARPRGLNFFVRFVRNVIVV